MTGTSITGARRVDVSPEWGLTGDLGLPAPCRSALRHEALLNSPIPWYSSSEPTEKAGNQAISEYYLARCFSASEPAGVMTTIATKTEHLDLATVIKVSQALSGEMVTEKLIDTLMRTAIEHATAERGLLILSSGAEQRIAAEATANGATLIVRAHDETPNSFVLPESALHWVVRTQESVILDDASAQNPFSTDPYVARRRVRSLMCLPLSNRGKLIGVLYLENNSATGVFVPPRVVVLKLLASQAAMSLENTRLYSDLAEREARIRGLVEANIVGIEIVDLDGRILEANEAFLRLVGYEREDLASGRLRWTDLTPSTWHGRDRQDVVAALQRSGRLQHLSGSTSVKTAAAYLFCRARRLLKVGTELSGSWLT